MNSATQTETKLSRAELRRAFKNFKKKEQYDNSNFLDFSEYKGVAIKKTKYTPHIGNKQKGIVIDYAEGSN